MFDPLPKVMLVILHNQVLLQNKPKEKTQDEHWKDIYSQPTFTDEDFSLEEEIIEEDNERMDIIGQNGNDGLHYDLEEDEKPKKVLGKGYYKP